MDSEIKRRIAQIRRGEVPEGYKRIQRDIVPKDWTIKSLADVCNNFSYGMNAAAKAYDGYNKYIRITDIDDNSHIYTGLDIVSPDADLELKYRVQENDILFARTGATVGKTYLYNKNDGILFFAGFMIRANVPMDNSYYVYEQTLTRRYLNWVRIMSQRSGQPGINAQEYGTYTFPYCRVEEQQKIAAILTTQDKVIELKEKRLAEKLRQKKYLMQQLLTGKKRLPGFRGEWRVEYLGKLFRERKETNCEGLEMLAITGTQGIIPRKELDLKDNSSEDKSKYLRICVGDIGYNTMRMWQGVSAYSDYEGIVSPAYTILKPSLLVDAKYFAYLFKMPEMIFLFYRFSQGLVDDTRNLKYENFKNIKVVCPVDKSEQTAIAQVLSTADREISLLRQDIEQEKQKKKALMQLLLTGIVRVKT